MEVDDSGFLQFSPSQASNDKQVIKRLLESDRALKNKVKSLELQVDRYRTTHRADVREKLSLQAQVRKLKKEVEKVKNKVSADRKREIVKEVLSPFYDQAQINLFLQGSWTKGRNWSIEILTMALTLKTLSNRCYVFLRKKKIIPLPGPATIIRHFKNFKVEPGFLDCVAQLLAIKAATLTNRQDRIIGLELDEVHIKKDITYHSGRDQVIGPNGKANVLLLRGIFKNFKIPIWYDFDKKMEEKELKEIITKLEDISYHVICITMDNGGDNVSLASSLEVEPDQPFFQHPTREGEKVFFFFDPVHLLKLMRNHILEKGFILESSEIIGKEQFEELMEKQGRCENTDTQLTKLTRKHIYPKDQEKQTVKTAVQLFSSSVALALELLSSEDAAMRTLSEFCLLCDSLFDTSIKVHPTKPFGKLKVIGHEHKETRS